MTKKTRKITASKPAPIYERIREILESARANVARSVNSTQVVSNWLIGREIFEEEQQGQDRADYGARLVADLSTRLQADYGRGYSIRNLQQFRDFYRSYSQLLEPRIAHAPRAQSSQPQPLVSSDSDIAHALRAQLSGQPAIGSLEIAHAARGELAHKSLGKIRYAARSQSAELTQPANAEIGHTARDQSWQPGQLHLNLSWTHYRALLRVESSDARGFYEIESLQNNWSARELERQINSLLFERLAKSKDKQGLLRLVTKGQEITTPADIFKDPVVIEFLGLPESPRLVESDLETALIDNLQAFLLELGKGFAFVARQERITLDGDHFYIDLVFYHTVLKCFVLIDLKIGKLTHEDLGQLQLYVNYYNEERLSLGDHPTLGLILCTDKNDAVVKYTLGRDQAQKIFASRYKLHLPSEADLREELRREFRQLTGSVPTPPRKKKPKKP